MSDVRAVPAEYPNLENTVHHALVGANLVFALERQR